MHLQHRGQTKTLKPLRQICRSVWRVLATLAREQKTLRQECQAEKPTQLDNVKK